MLLGAAVNTDEMYILNKYFGVYFNLINIGTSMILFNSNQRLKWYYFFVNCIESTIHKCPKKFIQHNYTTVKSIT